MTIPATIAIAELLYRYVEVPGINLGTRIVGGTKKTKVAERAIDQLANQNT